MAAQEIGSLYLGLGFDTAVFDRQIVQIPAKVNQATESIKKGFQAAGTHLDKFQVSTGATRAAVQNLSFQLNDIGTSLASGGSPFRVLAQQGGQVLQAFQQGGGFKKVMGEVSSSLGAIFTPARTAALGIVAVAGAFALLTARAVENAGAMRQFGVMLKGLGLEGQATADGLEAAAKRLKDVGLSAGDARAALRAATRAGISPGQAERVVRTGQNLIPVLGEDAPSQLNAAIAGGVEPLAKIATQLGLVTQREVEAAREAAKYGQELSYIERWFGLIEQRAKGLNKEALSPLGQQLRDLSTAWSEMLDKMANTGPIKAAIAAMTDLAKLLKAISEYKGAGEASSALAGAASGALIGRFFGPYGAAIGATIGGIGGAYYGARTATGPDVTSGGAMSSSAALALIEKYESGGRNIKNPTSSASGYWQFLDSTWREIAPRVGIDISKYPTAMSASRELQMAAATKLYEQKGFSPWAPYNPKLAAAIAGGGGLLARPGASRETFSAGAAQSFENEFAQTQVEINAERIRAGLLPGFGGPGGLTRAGFAAQAATEARGRFGFANEISNDPIAQEQIGRRLRQLTELGQARGRTSLAQGAEQDRQTTEQLKLQASLFGQSTQEIEKQVALLKIRQQAEAAGLPLTDEAVKAREAESKALADANAQLQRQQQLMTQMREVAGVFENAFSSAFDSIVSGTFKARAFLGSLLKDLGKTLASSAFRRLLGGDDSSGGLLGSIAGKLFGIGGLGGTNYDAINADPSFGGGGDIAAFAGGGSFAVGGSGSIDSQLVAFRASPGEMVQVTPANSNYAGGRGEVIHINLNPSEGWVAGVADQRIVTRSGQIVEVAVKQSQRTVQRNFAGMSAEAQARQL